MSQPTQHQLPAGRYGPAGGTGGGHGLRWTIVAVSAVAAVVLGWLAYATWHDPVQWSDVGFAVHGASSTDVTFDVTKAPDATVQCTVRALSESFAEVGVKTVTVGPADAKEQRVTATVPTQEIAVSGDVSDCQLADAG